MLQVRTKRCQNRGRNLGPPGRGMPSHCLRSSPPANQEVPPPSPEEGACLDPEVGEEREKSQPGR